MLVNDQQDSANNALHIAQQHHSTEVHHHHCCPNMASSKKQGVNVSDMASPAAMDSSHATCVHACTAKRCNCLHVRPFNWQFIL